MKLKNNKPTTIVNGGVRFSGTVTLPVDITYDDIRRWMPEDFEWTEESLVKSYEDEAKRRKQSLIEFLVSEGIIFFDDEAAPVSWNIDVEVF